VGSADRRIHADIQLWPAIWSIMLSYTSRGTKVRCFSSILMRSSAAFADACSVSAAARGDCRRSRASISDRQRGSGRAASLPLDAFGFELADVSPAAIEVQRLCLRADGAGFLDRGLETGLAATDGRSMVTASVIVSVFTSQ
jgi:hypothetical protein